MKIIKIMLLSVLMTLSCSYIVMSTSVYRSGDVMTGSDLFEEIIIALSWNRHWLCIAYF